MDSDALSDEEIVRRVLAGDAGAYGALVDRHAPACLRFAERMLASRTDAEAVTRDVLLGAYRMLARWDARTRLRAWLLALVVERCRTTLLGRCRKARVVTYDGERPGAGPAAPDPVTRAVAALEPAYREAFLLKHVEELTYGEIAAATGVALPSIRSRVRHACDRLRPLLAEVSDARP